MMEMLLGTSKWEGLPVSVMSCAFACRQAGRQAGETGMRKGR